MGMVMERLTPLSIITVGGSDKRGGLPAGEAVLRPGVPKLVSVAALAQDLQIARLGQKGRESPGEPAACREPFHPVAGLLPQVGVALQRPQLRGGRVTRRRAISPAPPRVPVVPYGSVVECVLYVGHTDRSVHLHLVRLPRD
jgi:hypothetical protein